MKNAKVLLVAMLAVGTLLTGCGGGDTNTDAKSSQSTDDTAKKESKGYKFDLKGVTVSMNEEMAPIVEKLGEADNYFESESCAFQGMDKVYTYGSVVVTTYPENEVDYVYTIELKDDTVTTQEGLYIGATKEDVIAKYGEATTATDNALVYEKDDSKLSFIMDDGATVSSITYTAITE
ncbi:MAG: hypothetical protein II250_02890 [Agathobacter sp.]|nr:hypothetical protein [Agathobacter sp.]